MDSKAPLQEINKLKNTEPRQIKLFIRQSLMLVIFIVALNLNPNDETTLIAQRSDIHGNVRQKVRGSTCET